MTTYADITKPKCCCIRSDNMFPELMLLENLIMLGVLLTLHYMAFLLGWETMCLGTLLGIYYGMYQLVVVYCKVNDRYLEVAYLYSDQDDQSVSRDEYQDADNEDEDADDEGEDEDQSADEDQEDKSDAEDQEDQDANEDQEDQDANEDQEDQDANEDQDADEDQEDQKDTKDQDDHVDDDEYAEMPPLISLDDDTNALRQLQQAVAADTNSNEDIGTQIKDTLRHLQDMITVAKERANVDT